MATARKRSWFFNAPPTSSGEKFVKNNIPTEFTYRQFLQSLAFKLEADDTASQTSQGLVKLGLDADVIDRSSAADDAMQTVVRPHQLPLLVDGDDTELDTIDSSSTVQALKMTPVNDAGSERMNFKLEMDFDSLTEAVIDIDNDYGLFLDADDNLLKKESWYGIISAITASKLYWTRTGTTLEPFTANDDIDIGTGDLYCADVILDNTGLGRSISVASKSTEAGVMLGILAGSSTLVGSDGGDLWLYGGQPGSGGSGGSVYLSSMGANGDVMIGYTHAGVSFGKIGLGCAADGTYLVKADGDMWVTGNIKLGNPLYSKPSGNTYIVHWSDTTNLLSVRSFSESLEDFLGAPSKGDILYYDGSSWGKIGSPSATDRYLYWNNVTGLPEWEAVSGATDEKVKVDSGATAGYLGAARSDGILRFPVNAGVSYTDNGDYVDLEFDVNDLAATSQEFINTGAIIPFYDGDGTRRISATTMYGTKKSGWIQLLSTTQFNTTAVSSNELVMNVDLTNVFEAGQPVMFKISTDTNYRYGIIESIVSNKITIAGDPFVTAAGGIEEFYVGNKEKVRRERLNVLQTNYNSTDTTKALEDRNSQFDGERWYLGSSKLVGFACIHEGNDTGAQPFINIRLGSTPADYVCTSNSNAGLQVSTSWSRTTVDIESGKNSLSFGEKIEVKVTNDTGAANDADNLQIEAIFIII